MNIIQSVQTRSSWEMEGCSADPMPLAPRLLSEAGDTALCCSCCVEEAGGGGEPGPTPGPGQGGVPLRVTLNLQDPQSESLPPTSRAGGLGQRPASLALTEGDVQGAHR